MTPPLAVENISTSYGLSRVLFGGSLEITAGERVCLLGRNGVGKTSTMRSIMELTPPSSGRILWRGRDIQLGAAPRGAPGSAFLPRTAVSSPSSASGRTSASVLGPRGGPGHGRSLAVAELFPVLRERRTQRGGFLSGGEQQMLTIARAFTGNPELLLLDEPSERLAPLVVETLRVKIAELKEQGLTILLAERSASISRGQPVFRSKCPTRRAR